MKQIEHTTDEIIATINRATFTPNDNGAEAATVRLINTHTGFEPDGNPVTAYERMLAVAVSTFEANIGRPATDAERNAVYESTAEAFHYAAGVLAGNNNWRLQHKRREGVTRNANEKHQRVVDTWLTLGQPEYAAVSAVLQSEYGMKYKPATVGSIIRRHLAGDE